MLYTGNESKTPFVSGIALILKQKRKHDQALLIMPLSIINVINT